MDYSVEEKTFEGILHKIKFYVIPSDENGYRSKFLQSNILLYCVVLVAVLKIFASIVSINFPNNIFFADIAKSSLEAFVNQTRQSAGLNTLTKNDKLDKAALLKAENMLQNQYFNHVSPSGITPWFWFVKAGYNYKYAGENLAIGFYESEEVFNAWLNSPSHKENIVNPNYTEVGTAVLGGFGANNSIVVVQEFGSQLPVKQAVVKNIPVKQVLPQNSQPVQTTVLNTNEKVLSETTQAQNSIEPQKKTGISNLPSKIVNSVLYGYDDILQGIIYGFSLIIIGILMTLIFFNFNIKFKKALVLRAVVVIVLLSLATLVNKETIIAFIPHQILI